MKNFTSKHQYNTWIPFLIILSLSQNKSFAIEITEFSFKNLPEDQTVVLKCLHQVHGSEQLDTFRLGLNGSEFYSFAPYASANYQKQAQFWVDGVSVDIENSNGTHVFLNNVRNQIIGIFNCKVSSDMGKNVSEQQHLFEIGPNSASSSEKLLTYTLQPSSVVQKKNESIVSSSADYNDYKRNHHNAMLSSNTYDQQQSIYHRRYQMNTRTSTATKSPIGQPAYTRTFQTAAINQNQTNEATLDDRRVQAEEERKRHLIELERRQKLLEQHRLLMLQRQQEDAKAQIGRVINVNQPKQQPGFTESESNSVANLASTADVDQSRILHPEYLAHFTRLNLAKVFSEIQNLRDQLISLQENVRYLEREKRNYGK